MSPKRTHTALQSKSSSEFLNYILDYHKEPTILIICSSKEDFLEDLFTSVQASESSAETSLQHPLLLPTIHLIASSQGIQLAFTSTLQQLRAYLSTYMITSNPAQSVPGHTNARHQTPILALWGVINLHRSTAEYSAQGLSCTLASAVEAAFFGNQRLVVGDLQLSSEQDDSWGNASHPSGTYESPWKAQVPVLSGSIGYSSEERNWAGKTVEVGQIIARWCKLKNPELENSTMR